MKPILLLLTLMTGIATGQIPAGSTARTTPSEVEHKATAMRRAADEQPKLVVKYDRFRDETTVSLHLDLTPAATAETPYPNWFWVEVAAIYPGRSPIEPKAIHIDFTTRLGGFDYDRELIFLVDGKRFRLGSMRGYSSAAGGFIPYRTLLIIANGSKVEGKAGFAEFELKEKEKAALKRFAQHFHQ